MLDSECVDDASSAPPASTRSTPLFGGSPSDDAARTAFIIDGGVALRGALGASGAKNAALPIMAAALLARERVWLERVPRLADVDTLSLVLGHLGVEVKREPDGRVRIETVDDRPVSAPKELVRRMRASVCVLGPLVARRGRAVIPLPGGCAIGRRPVDLHLKGLAALGADVRIDGSYAVVAARRLRGTIVDMAGSRGPTVTGTANLLCAAVVARGRTVLRGAAREPEIEDLGTFLISLGARIDGLGTHELVIDGVDALGGGSYRLIADRIEAATYLLAAAVTGGEVTVEGVQPSHLAAVLATLRRMGAFVEVSDSRVTLAAPQRLRACDVLARPYPDVPTDLQAPLTATLALADGRSHVRDGVFPERFLHVAGLVRMGARIRSLGDVVAIDGVAQLHPATVAAADLRGGAALVLAGLAAPGRTVVRRADHVDRGYDGFAARLTALGGRVTRHCEPR